MLRRIENRVARATVRGGAKLASVLGLRVRQDRDNADRYFIQTWKGHNHYILSYRKKKYRTGIFEGDTFRQYHLGFMSFYREVGNRFMWDIPQREEG